MRVTITGAKPYRVRTPDNLNEWRETVSGFRVHEDGTAAADVDELRKKGVRQMFISYLLRNGFLKLIP